MKSAYLECLACRVYPGLGNSPRPPAPPPTPMRSDEKRRTCSRHPGLRTGPAAPPASQPWITPFVPWRHRPASKDPFRDSWNHPAPYAASLIGSPVSSQDFSEAVKRAHPSRTPSCPAGRP